MMRWMILSFIYMVLFLISGKFAIEQAIAGGLLCGGVSILVAKLFKMDK